MSGGRGDLVIVDDEWGQEMKGGDWESKPTTPAHHHSRPLLPGVIPRLGYLPKTRLTKHEPVSFSCGRRVVTNTHHTGILMPGNGPVSLVEASRQSNQRDLIQHAGRLFVCNGTRPTAWVNGHVSAQWKLHGRPQFVVEQVPYAELWVGTHVSAPSIMDAGEVCCAF